MATARSRSSEVLFAAVAIFVLSVPAIPQDHASMVDWPIAAPEKIGIVPANLQALDRDIARGKFGLLDSVLFIRCGKIGYERSFPHDFARIYRKKIKKEGPLNHDPTGEYNYFNPEFHPFYRGSDLHTCNRSRKPSRPWSLGLPLCGGFSRRSRHARAQVLCGSESCEPR